APVTPAASAPVHSGDDHAAPVVPAASAPVHAGHDHTPAAPVTPAASAPVHSGDDHAPTAPVAPAMVSSGDGHGHVHAAPTLAPAGLGHGMGSGAHVMRHPGLPKRWILPAVLLMVGLAIGAMLLRAPVVRPVRTYNLSTAPLIGWLVRLLNSGPWPLVFLRIVSVLLFLLVVLSGLFGTPLAERSLATVFTWNLWWPLVVISVFFFSSAWCAICPWDTIANWLVRRRLWRRAVPHPGLNRKVPVWLRNVFPALLLFMGLTWLELGIGVTTIPKATALMALVMVVLATVGLLIFERKAFCRYGCPVGRTMGLYARLAPIEVRSQRQEICDTCKTMECYNGSQEIEPCPTYLTVGRFSQNTYCLSCGNCVLSCPHDNVSWRLRSMGSEAMEQARPQWDSAWFMLILLGITSFHGVTMMPFWTDWVVWIAGRIGETGQLIASFTIGMWTGFFAPVAVYALAILATWWLSPPGTRYRRLFVTLSFFTLPMAFTYHLAHNLSHLLREGGEWPALLLNPLGSGLLPMTAAERHQQMMTLWMPEEVMFATQAGLMVLGVWLAVAILRYRGLGVLGGNRDLVGWRLIPMLLFMGIMTAFDFWLLSEDMVMRF
ncbi:MAG: 4Fe-4S binding protein, partial [Magnetococcales bacterium]|nr:4Fe-4S binding protein [Magnetococcales bacterium]